MAKFEICKQYEDKNINLPQRKTKYSAGYDFEAAEDIVIPSIYDLINRIKEARGVENQIDLNNLSNLTQRLKCRPTIVPTGIKCKLAKDEYLQLAIRSSFPLKYQLILANGVGIIDADYYGNIDNDGAIGFQFLNFSPFEIKIKKGEAIGQGIIMKYITTENDEAQGERIGGFGSTTK